MTRWLCQPVRERERGQPARSAMWIFFRFFVRCAMLCFLCKVDDVQKSHCPTRTQRTMLTDDFPKRLSHSSANNACAQTGQNDQAIQWLTGLVFFCRQGPCGVLSPGECSFDKILTRLAQISKFQEIKHVSLSAKLPPLRVESRGN